MAAVLVVLGWGGVAAPAASAATLVASNPAPRQELSDPPGWVTLAFNDTITKSGVKILVLNSDGRNVAVGDLVYMGSSVMVQLDNDLRKDTYTVQYRLKNSKGVPEGGAFQFAYGQGKWTDLPDATWTGEAEQPPAMANPDPQATEAVKTASAATTVPEVEVEKSDGSTLTPTPPALPTPAESAAATPGAEATDSAGAGWLPWVLGGGVIAVAAGFGSWWILKRRTP